MDATMNNCTHDCSTCGAACDEGTPAKKDIFTHMEDLSDALYGDDGYEMLQKLNAELDALDK